MSHLLRAARTPCWVRSVDSPSPWAGRRP